MASLQQAKTLGGVGSILGILGIIPFAGPVLGIIGLVMTLIAVKYISEVVGDKAIFNNMIVSVVLAIIGIIVFAVFIVGTISRFVGMGNLFPTFGGSQPFNPSSIPPSDFIGLIGGIVVGLAALWVFAIVSAIFLRMSYKSVSSKLSIGMFGTAAMIYLIGAILTIILVGFVLIFVAQILLIVAFFSIREQLPQPMQSSTTPMTPTSPSMAPPPSSTP